MDFRLPEFPPVLMSYVAKSLNEADISPPVGKEGVCRLGWGGEVLEVCASRGPLFLV